MLLSKKKKEKDSTNARLLYFQNSERKTNCLQMAVPEAGLFSCGFWDGKYADKGQISKFSLILLCSDAKSHPIRDGFFYAKEGKTMAMINMVATGNRIAELRDAAGLDNTDIADALGLTTRNAIYRWLNGSALPSIDNLVVLAEMFGVRLDDIIITNTSRI